MRRLLERLGLLNPPLPVVRVGNNTLLRFENHRVGESVIIEVHPEPDSVPDIQAKVFNR